MPAEVIHSREEAGEHLQHQAMGEQVVGERGEFGGVAAEPLHLVHREDDPPVGLWPSLPTGARG